MADKDNAVPVGLIKKLASIRRELKNIEKKGRNTHQNYDYLRAEDIAGEIGDRLAAVNVILSRENLAFAASTIEATNSRGEVRTDARIIVTLDYVFCDGDSGERLSVASIGEGRDSGDKASAKAMTNALKYALSQPLMMRVGDDPEADAPHDTDKGRAKHSGISQTPASQIGRLTAKEASTLVQKLRAAMGDEEGPKWFRGRLKEMDADPTCVEALAETTLGGAAKKLSMGSGKLLIREIEEFAKSGTAAGVTQPPEQPDIDF